MLNKKQNKKEKEMLVPSKRVIDAILEASGELINPKNTTNQTTITQASEPESVEKTKNIDFNLNLDFGKKGGKLASQLKAQGFVLNKQDIKNCESIRTDLLAMEHVKVLKKKEVRKAFERVTEQIGQAIAKKYFGENVTMKRIK